MGPRGGAGAVGSWAGRSWGPGAEGEKRGGDVGSQEDGLVGSAPHQGVGHWSPLSRV